MKRNQEGVMLIEVLIGLLIFSIGILAMLGMQATAMRATVDSKYRSEAGFLANQLVGIMWSDADDLSAYATANCPSTAACDNWLTSVEQLLPQATGANAPAIDVVGRQVTVTLRWQRPGESTVSQHQVVANIFRAGD
jgi:type IV pilus assembly protein PilV